MGGIGSAGNGIRGLKRNCVRKHARKGGKSFYPPTFKELPPPM